LARSSSFETDLTLAVILFRFSESKGFPEVVYSGQLEVEHGHHACLHSMPDVLVEMC